MTTYPKDQLVFYLENTQIVDKETGHNLYIIYDRMDSKFIIRGKPIYQKLDDDEDDDEPKPENKEETPAEDAGKQEKTTEKIYKPYSFYCRDQDSLIKFIYTIMPDGDLFTYGLYATDKLPKDLNMVTYDFLDSDELGHSLIWYSNVKYDRNDLKEYINILQNVVNFTYSNL